MTFWKLWKYKNITLFFLCIALTAILFEFEPFHMILIQLGNFSYIGAFFAGMLFVSTFTVALGALILLTLAEYLHAVEICLIAGCGAVLADFTMFHFVKNHLVEEIFDLYEKIDSNHHLVKLLHSHFFSWTLPVLGALIIASPLPDELGVSLLGISRMKPLRFLLLSFILNSLGILFVVSAATIIKP